MRLFDSTNCGLKAGEVLSIFSPEFWGRFDVYKLRVSIGKDQRGSPQKGHP